MNDLNQQISDEKNFNNHLKNNNEKFQDNLNNERKEYTNKISTLTTE